MKTVLAIAAALTFAAIALPLQAQQPAQPSGQIVFKTPQEAVRYYEDLIGQACTQLRDVQDTNAKLALAVTDLQKQVAALSQSNQAMAQDVAALKKQLSSEASARQDQLGQVMGAIKQKAAESAAAERESVAASAKAAAASSSTEMYEITVPPGGTLSVIAKTCKVSVSEIKAANDLKSDTLRAGQKLLIPKK